jgi:hypothetical protein
MAIPFLPSPPTNQNRGRGGVAGAAGRRKSPANRATAADGRWGKTERAPRGFYSRAHLELGRRREMDRRAAAVCLFGGSGGSTVECREGCGGSIGEVWGGEGGGAGPL